ncbi:uncharacterized protein CC84DRAFT_1217900 [Paraphaeosphaeria sporulosa]|uniref:Methyltransferase domain-containing protein n=1 Tax=Paraphaeosphaeria sporulosa TaxID=1460663 RepID=A0A177CCD0_9PLEO|nr:uncharacterized protein CC84DRAFT_1217900 [Paraphaeosphaeria sporulosa]OAG04447.1 hypothetical protein CC84DRAFT_1217900 [Paraphaeosphaeria sporulosa]
MGPEAPLPLPAEFSDVDEYVESLLKFATTSWMLQTLCGGVHILDFYTRSPDLYATILPESWRKWFRGRDIMDILDLLMREDLGQFNDSSEEQTWRDGPVPPEELLLYIRDVRKHLLARDFPPPGAPAAPKNASIARHIAMGMKVKKVHEVDNFARFIDRLTAEIKESGRKEITHLVDFGSGQNYLGRALAAPPYSKHLVAVESRQHNIEGAKKMDIKAKLVEKPVTYVNKKKWRAENEQDKRRKKNMLKGLNVHADELVSASDAKNGSGRVTTTAGEASTVTVPDAGSQTAVTNAFKCDDDGCNVASGTQYNGTSDNAYTITTNLQVYTEGQGSVQYVEHIIKDGDLNPVIDQVRDSTSIRPETSSSTPTVVEETTSLSNIPKSTEVNAMVMSLHSCGNLVHHGLRSLLLSPAVSAVAMVGCCYNLVTERLGPPTYKLPTLRPNHPRLEKTANAFDPHGFPMSERLASYPLPHAPLPTSNGEPESVEQPKGIRLNITSRMMAVQAPFNWGRVDSELFFSRHYYRALLQRIFLERGVVSAPVDGDGTVGGSASGHTSRVEWTPPNGRGPGLSSDGTSTPLTIGTLRKFAYSDFKSYVRAAITKLISPNSFCEVDPDFIKGKMDGLTDEDIEAYEERFREKKHELSVMWSLMAFSAGVVEAVIVTDRWLWLKEQPEVERAWVEPVFDYALSPRNLVVVGIKKQA